MAHRARVELRIRCPACYRLKPRAAFTTRGSSGVCAFCQTSAEPRRRLAIRSPYVAWLCQVQDRVGFDQLGHINHRVRYPPQRWLFGGWAGTEWGPRDDRASEKYHFGF